MKGYLFFLVAMIAISGCLSAPSNKEMEEFAEKVIKVAEQLNKLRKEFIESLNQTSNEKILEEYTTKGVSALNQQVQAKFSKGIRPDKYQVVINNLLRDMHVESELKEKIANKLYEIQNDQTGEIITEKFMFGGASNDVRYIFIMGKKNLDTGKFYLASTIVTAQITLSKNLLIMETTTGTITEKKEEIKPEEFDDIDIQLIKSLCEYIAIKGMVNFFKNNK